MAAQKTTRTKKAGSVKNVAVPNASQKSKAYGRTPTDRERHNPPVSNVDKI